MLLVFWVLWRLRWLSWRETFAAVRLPIPGAVPSSAAVMAFYLRSFEADKLNTCNTSAESRRFFSRCVALINASRNSVLPDTKRRGGLDGLAACKTLASSSLHCSSAKASAVQHPCPQ